MIDMFSRDRVRLLQDGLWPRMRLPAYKDVNVKQQLKYAFPDTVASCSPSSYCRRDTPGPQVRHAVHPSPLPTSSVPFFLHFAELGLGLRFCFRFSCLVLRSDCGTRGAAGARGTGVQESVIPFVFRPSGE